MKFKKILSVFMSFALLMILIPDISVKTNAAYENTHTNTGNQREDIVAVAETQIGYQEGTDNDTKYNRWNGTISGYPVGGYGYPWCQCFVSWCANQADIDTDIIPKTAGTSTAQSFFMNQGVYHQSASNGGSYVPQRGDIVFYGSGTSPSHVGIISSCDGDSISTIEGNYSDGVGTRTISLYNSYVIGFASPNYPPIPDPDPPKNVVLDKNQYWYDIEDTIELYPSSDNANNFYMAIYKDNTVVRDGWITGTYRIAASDLGYGDYVVWVTASNSAGTADSNHLEIPIVGVPGYTGVHVSKPAYSLSETVSISVDTVCAKGAVIGIDRNGVERAITEGCNNGIGTYEISASSLGVGEYSAYFSVYNGSGSIDTTRVSFKIYDKAPSVSVLFANKDKITVDEEITFTASSDCAVGYTMGIDNSEGRYLTPDMTDGQFTISFNEPGEYSAYVTSYNNLGYVDSERVFFTVYAPKLDAPDVTVSKSEYAPDEIVKISWNAVPNATYYWINIMKDGKSVINQLAEGLFYEGKLEIGSYDVYVASANPYGDAIGHATFQVGISGDINEDNVFDTADIVLLKKYLNNKESLTEAQFQTADLNQDGKVNIYDFILLKKSLLAG